MVTLGPGATRLQLASNNRLVYYFIIYKQEKASDFDTHIVCLANFLSPEDKAYILLRNLP